jgi:hypothetical protein
LPKNVGRKRQSISYFKIIFIYSQFYHDFSPTFITCDLDYLMNMEKLTFKVYGYRWIMLAIYMFMVAMNQLLWITFAPITSEAVQYYGVSDLWIGILSMSFMVVFIIFSIPASWIIDTYGIKIGVGIGAVLTGVFGMTRGLVTTNFTLLLISQIGIDWNCHWPTFPSQCDYQTFGPLVPLK